MLKEILAISGKPGLNKLISNTANAIIVESLIDSKRFAAYSNTKIISLEDISIYTENEDMPLKEVLKRMFEKAGGEKVLSHKEETPKIVAYFDEIFPEYDRNRVYMSDLKKILQWYNLLIDKNLLNFDNEKEENTEVKAEEIQKKEKKEIVKNAGEKRVTKTKANTAKTTNTAAKKNVRSKGEK